MAKRGKLFSVGGKRVCAKTMKKLFHFVFKAFGVSARWIGRFWDSGALYPSANARGSGFSGRMGVKFQLFGGYSGNGGQSLIFGGIRARNGGTPSCASTTSNGCLAPLRQASAFFWAALQGFPSQLDDR